MTWLKLDDGWQSHPKMQRIGPMGRELWLAGALYAARHLTDGLIDKSAVPMLMGVAGVKPIAERILVERGVWHDRGDCYEIHDYLDYNPSHAEVERGREEGRDRQRRSRDTRTSHTVTDAVTDTVTDTVSNGSASPDPSRPVPSLSVTTPPTTTTSLPREVVVVLEAICYVETAGAIASGKVEHPGRYRASVLDAKAVEWGQRLVSAMEIFGHDSYFLAKSVLAEHDQLNAILIRIADTEDSCSTLKHDDSALDSKPSGPTDGGPASTNGDSSSSPPMSDLPTEPSTVSATSSGSSRPSRSGARRTSVSPEAKPKRPGRLSGKDRPMPPEQSLPESKPTSPPVAALSGPAFLGAQLGKKGRPRNEVDDLVRDYSEEDRAVALAAYREQIPERRRIEGEVWQMASIDDGKVHCVRVTNGFVGGFRCTFPADMWSTAAVVEA